MSDLPKEKLPDQREADQGGGTSDETVLTKAPESKQDKLRRIIKELPHGKKFIFNNVGGKKIRTAFTPRLVSNVYRTMHSVIFDTAMEIFHVYEPRTGLFRPKSHDDIREELAALTLDIGEALSKGKNKTQASIIANIANKATSSSAINGHMAALKSATSGNFDKENEGVAHCLSGFIDLDTGENLGRHPRFKSRNMSPFHAAETSNCPLWTDVLLGQALSDHDDIETLQMLFGQYIFGENKSQSILLLYGTAGRGKGVVASVAQALAGAGNWHSLPHGGMRDRFATFPMLGKSLLVGVDVPSTFLAHPDANILKSLTGGDGMMAEGKFMRHQSMLHGNYNVIITSNAPQQLRLDGDADAWNRRCIPICFDQPKVEDIIRDFDKLLMSKCGGEIWRWAFEGYRKLKALGYKIKRTAAQDRRMQNILDETSSVKMFAADCLEAGNGNVSYEELTTAYCDYCRDRGWRRVADTKMRENLRTAVLEQYGRNESTSVHRETGNCRGFRRVQIKDQPQHQIKEAA